ncbi:RluA family pseudouridine synthase [Treponema sp.]|uniref:RluA family pseudouridine synthase n=1 Tax=Treponema sp. TaxID=166 RepID=UPI00298DB2C2|nr:RluA family pseudouridine synthase [Treponema sp.]MCR5612971.1 RluA family pseudouridine synthase [Treponema sp.]
MERIEILYKDANVIIISKPNGILSVPYNGSRAKNAQDILEQMLRRRGEYSQKYKVLPVHRLDRETSGVMMFATNERAQKTIMDNWHDMVKSRAYIALAENPGNFTRYGILPDSGIIDDKLSYNAYNVGYVARHEKTRDDNRRENTARSRDNARSKDSGHEITARTHFKIINRSTRFSIFKLELDTGRKNQIRAHLASKGYPIAGDKNYRAHTDPFKRVCLHARTLEYLDPWTGELKKFEVEEPKEWWTV